MESIAQICLHLKYSIIGAYLLFYQRDLKKTNQTNKQKNKTKQTKNKQTNKKNKSNKQNKQKTIDNWITYSSCPPKTAYLFCLHALGEFI